MPRARFSSKPDVCSADGFDHYEEFCCECLQVKMNWIYYEDDACAQCKLRQLIASERIALEVQRPFSQKLMDGSKTIETRGYQLPEPLLGRSIALVETDEGAANVSSLPNTVDAGYAGAKLVGHAIFRACVEYSSRAQWDADASKHLVPPESAYAYPEEGGASARKWGWVVERCKAEPEGPQPVPTLRRRLRSLFVMEAAKSNL